MLNYASPKRNIFSNSETTWVTQIKALVSLFQLQREFSFYKCPRDLNSLNDTLFFQELGISLYIQNHGNNKIISEKTCHTQIKALVSLFQLQREFSFYKCPRDLNSLNDTLFFQELGISLYIQNHGNNKIISEKTCHEILATT